MPTFSKQSKDKLNTCDKKLVKVFTKVIERFDCTIICGHRTQGEQLQLFKQGRTLVDGKWIKTGKTVTNLDGYKKVGRHNSYPSEAVDVVPYPIDWNDLDRFKELSKVIKEVALEEGVELTWGGDWDSFKDFPHWELTK